jgi:hypothetical protein
LVSRLRPTGDSRQLRSRRPRISRMAHPV